MDMILWFLVILILVAIAYVLLSGDSVRGNSYFGGAPSGKKGKKPAAKKTKAPAKKAPKTVSKSAPKAEKSEPGVMPPKGWEIYDSENCVKAVADGKKNTTARLNGDYFRNMKKGDKIHIKTKDADGVTKVIKEINEYSSFEEMFNKHDPKDVFSCDGVNDKNNAMKHYADIYGKGDASRLKEREEQRGVVAIVFA